MDGSSNPLELSKRKNVGGLGLELELVFMG